MSKEYNNRWNKPLVNEAVTLTDCKQNVFSEFDTFDLALGLYHWLQHNWEGQSDSLYEAFSMLTEPGIYKPSLSEEYFKNIDDSARNVYELLTRDNYEDALDLVLNYESKG